MTTIEEVVADLPQAKVFSVLDATSGYWQVKLDEASSKLCIFNTPFGRYRFTRLPFGIKSAPVVFQNHMSELFADVEGVKVIVDDLLVWDHLQEESFQKLKQLASSTPVLGYYDPSKPLCLSVDASSKGLGAVLLQDEKPLAYASRALTPTQQRYAQIEKETLAIVYGVQKLHQYIYGRTTDVEIDHKPLQ